jgi:hypothetical protein
MNVRADEANLRQLASDVHLLTWPIRWIVGLIKTAIFLAIFILAVPTIFIGLVIHFVVTGHSLLDADAVLALKVVTSFVFPFAMPIVYRFAQALSGRRDVVRQTYVFQHWHILLITLGLMLVGALCNFAWWDEMNSELGLELLVLYLSSPLSLLLVRRKLPALPALKNNVLCFPDLTRASRSPQVW